MVIQGNKIPLSSQVAETLKQRVRTGLYQIGNPLPPVRHLSKEFEVSQGIVQQAIRKLEEVGVVKAHHGKGVLIQDGALCSRTAILFGFIHPYPRSMNFHRDVLAYVDEAFSEHSNFALVRSSNDDPTIERETAEHLIANGVRGLILWPTNNDPNGGYFMKLSQKIPVVLVDRLLPGANLPAVLLNHHACGRKISQTLFSQMNKKRLLVLMDNLLISSYQNLSHGIEAGARELKRWKDVTIVQLPITQAIQKGNKLDSSEIDHYEEFLERLLAEGGYDSLFCTQDQFIGLCFTRTRLADKFPSVQPVTIRPTCPPDRIMGHRPETTLPCLEWLYNSEEMVSLASDMVQRWVLTRQMPKENLLVDFEFDGKPGASTESRGN